MYIPPSCLSHIVTVASKLPAANILPHGDQATT